MFKRISYFFSDLGHWITSHLPGKRAGIAIAVALGVAALGVGAYFLVDAVSEEEPPPPAAAPPAVVTRVEASDDEADKLGFPAFATKNTTRISGADEAADAAAVALATYPSTGGIEGPAAVSLVDVEDWAGAVAASVLAADPVSAPILFSEDGDIPSITQSALEALDPKGSAETEDKQVFRIGDAPEPEGLRSDVVAGQTPPEIAASIEKLRRKLTGSEPANIVVASADEPSFAMPAAAWAARSGDPVLFAQKNSIPKPTLETIKSYEDVPVYVLGPESAISDKAEKLLDEAAGGDVERIAESDPVTNAIEFARFSGDGFGWNINDPGHGFVLANADRPADAGAAAPLSASGTWGPLLLTDSADRLPDALRGYLLDLKPGYEDDPTRALYNHLWLMGDPDAISVGLQAQVDELAELVKVTSGSGSDVLGPPPGAPEPESDSGGKDQPTTKTPEDTKP